MATAAHLHTLRRRTPLQEEDLYEELGFDEAEGEAEGFEEFEDEAAEFEDEAESEEGEGFEAEAFDEEGFDEEGFEDQAEGFEEFEDEAEGFEAEAYEDEFEGFMNLKTPWPMRSRRKIATSSSGGCAGSRAALRLLLGGSRG